MNRSLWAVLIGTFTLRFSTGLTGLTLTYYLANLGDHQRFLDDLFHLGQGRPVGDLGFGVIAALFYVAELTLSPVFGVISDRLGHHRVMQYGPIFGIVAVIATWATTSLPVIGATRLLEGSATAASVPSILGYIAVVTAMDEGLRGKASARFEAATLAGLLGGFVTAGLLWQAIGPETFLVNAVIYALSLAIYRFRVDPALDPTAQPQDPSRPRFDLGRYRRVIGGTHALLLAPTWIAINAVLGLYTTQTVFQLTQKADLRFPDQLLMGGFESTEISLGIAIGGILFFAGIVYWGNRFKNLRRTTIILYGIGGGLLVVAGAVALNHSGGLGVLPRLVFALPLVFGVFVLAGATPAAIGLLADVTEAFPEDRGAVMGLYSVFLGLGQITGSVIGGLSANALGLDGIFGASVILLVLAVVPLMRLREYEHFLGPGRAEALG
ncbi:MAG TPA: MFS transporter [Candidatus Limnocylindrales bacterium]|nr:MFS transporter [Candidatus Limnocylindrales bacterium]